jgi:hypothetical protein
MASIDDVYRLLHDGLRPGPNQTSGGGVPIAWIVRKVAEMQASLAAILAQGVAAASGVTDPGELTAAADGAYQSAMASVEAEITAMLTAGDE